MCVCVCVCVCVWRGWLAHWCMRVMLLSVSLWRCVCERKRETERKRERQQKRDRESRGWLV